MPDTLGSWEIVIYCESESNIKLCINKNEVKDRIEFLMRQESTGVKELEGHILIIQKLSGRGSLEAYIL